jgi:hypothetical protein
VRLDFPDEGSRDVWFAADLPSGPPTPTMNTKAQSTDFPVDRADPKDKLFVWDRTTGNLAFRPISDLKGVWSLKSTDFKFIGVVHVKVEHEGVPVAAASIELKDGKRAQTAVLDPTAKGMADFYGVAPGQVTLTTLYRSAGRTQPPQKQIFVLTLGRDKPEPELDVDISEEVATVGASPSGGNSTQASTEGTGSGSEGGAAKEAKKEESRPNVFVQLLFACVIFGLGFAVVIYLIRYLNKNAAKVQKQLNMLGVAIPDTADADVTGAPPARPAAPLAPEKIILGDPALAPAPTPTAAPTPIVAPVGTGSTFGNPRLTTDSGQIFQLSEGTSLVSREAGAPISLGGDTSVSRRHAEVVRAGNAVSIRDLGSTNGTYVNGVKVVGEVRLNPGDVVLFGTVRLRFEG